MPPVSQTLPATQSQHHTPASTEAPSDKPQSNGTAEVKSPTKPEPQENHVSLPRDKSPVPPTSPKTCERLEEKTSSTALPEQKQNQDSAKVVEEVKVSTPETTVSSVPSSSPATNAPSNENTESAPPSASNDADPKIEVEAESSETNSRESQSESIDSANTEPTQNSPAKSKDKEQVGLPATNPKATTKRDIFFK
jgi:hypothetical protein